MRRFLLSALCFLACVSAAQAQVNVVPQVGLTTAYLPKTTYSAAFNALTPAATPTDVLCIAGSASRTVKVMSIKLWATAASAVQTMPVNLLRRTSADTGTVALTTLNPNNNIAKRDINSPTATATLATYGTVAGNPTIVDSSPTYIDSGLLTAGIVTSVLAAAPLEFSFAKDINNLVNPPILVGAAAQICANFVGVALTNTTLVNGSVTWTEE